VRLGSAVWGGALAVGAAAIARSAIRTEDGREVDAELFSLVNAGHGPKADALFGGVTELGSLWASAAAAGTLALTGRRHEAARAFAAAATTWALLQGLKRMVDRPRPSVTAPEATRLLVALPPEASWPSSHPAVLTTFTRVASRELDLGGVPSGALTGLDLAVAASRVYVGVHYPSDVASGLLIGRAIARWWPKRRG
jgi:membrane-associated phospholipid phosphatase